MADEFTKLGLVDPAKTLQVNIGPKPEQQDFPDFNEGKYKIDHDFLTEREGGVRSVGYVPSDKDGAAIGQSGTTILDGFDVGQWDAPSLKEIGVSDPTIEYLKPWLGKKGKEAQEIASDLVVDADQTRELRTAIKKHFNERISTQFEDQTGQKFTDLSSGAQTAVMSVGYQYGNLARTPKLMKAFANGDMYAAIQELRNFGDKYGTRRNLEADLIEADFNRDEIDQDDPNLAITAAQDAGPATADDLQMSKETGLPLDLVQKNSQELRKRKKQAEVAALPAGSATSKTLSSFERMMASQNSIAELAKSETEMSLGATLARGGGFLAGDALTSQGGALEQLAWLWTLPGRGVASALDAAGAKDFRKAVEGWQADKLPWWSKLDNILRAPGQQLEKAGKAVTPTGERSWFDTVMGGAGTMGAQVAVGILSGGITKAPSFLNLFGMGMDQQADQIAEKAKKDPSIDVDSWEVGLSKLYGGALTAVSERFSLDRIINKLPASVRGRLFQVVEAAGLEFAQEFLENLGHNLVLMWQIDKNHKVFEGISFKELSAAATVGGAANIIAQAVTPGRSRRAAQVKSTMDQAVQSTAESEVQALNPEIVGEHRAEAIKQGGIEEVTIPAEPLMDLVNKSDNPAQMIADLGISEQMGAILEDQTSKVIISGEALGKTLMADPGYSSISKHIQFHESLPSTDSVVKDIQEHGKEAIKLLREGQTELDPVRAERTAKVLEEMIAGKEGTSPEQTLLDNNETTAETIDTVIDQIKKQKEETEALITESRLTAIDQEVSRLDKRIDELDTRIEEREASGLPTVKDTQSLNKLIKERDKLNLEQEQLSIPDQVAALRPEFQQEPSPVEPEGVEGFHVTPADFKKFSDTEKTFGTGAGFEAAGTYFGLSKGSTNFYTRFFSDQGKSTKTIRARLKGTLEEDYINYDLPMSKQSSKIQELTKKFSFREGRVAIEQADIAEQDKRIKEIVEELSEAKGSKRLQLERKWQTATTLKEIATKEIERLQSEPETDMSGRQFYKELSKQLGSDVAASKALRKEGIIGVQFKDVDTKQNDVAVFDANDITIVDIDGKSQLFDREVETREDKPILTPEELDKLVQEEVDQKFKASREEAFVNLEQELKDAEADATPAVKEKIAELRKLVFEVANTDEKSIVSKSDEIVEAIDFLSANGVTISKALDRAVDQLTALNPIEAQGERQAFVIRAKEIQKENIKILKGQSTADIQQQLDWVDVANDPKDDRVTPDAELNAWAVLAKAELALRTTKTISGETDVGARKNITTKAAKLRALGVRQNRQSVAAVRKAFRIGKKDVNDAVKQLNTLVSESGLSPADQNKFRRTLNSITSTEALQKKLPVLESRMLNLLDKQRKRDLTKALKKVVKSGKSKTDSSGKPTASATPEVAKALDSIDRIFKMSKDDAAEMLGKRQAEYNMSNTPTPSEAMENSFLTLVSDPDGVSAARMESVLLNLEDIVNQGKSVRKAFVLGREAATTQLREDLKAAMPAEPLDPVSVGRLRFENAKTYVGIAWSGAWWQKMQKIMDTTDKAEADRINDALSLTRESRVQERNKQKRTKKWVDAMTSTLNLSERQLLKKMQEDAETVVHIGGKGVKFKHADTLKPQAPATVEPGGFAATPIKDEIVSGTADLDIQEQRDAARVARLLKKEKVLKEGKRKSISFTKSELRQRWMEMQNDDLRDLAMQPESEGYTQEILDAIDAEMTAEDKQIAQVMMEQYNDFYADINEVYERMYGVTLPQVDNYVPISRSQKTGEPDEFIKSIQYRGGVVPGSLKSRQPSTAKLKKRGDFQTMQQHMMEMEYYIAFGEKVAVMNQVFDDKVFDRIEEVYGDKLAGTIRKDLDWFSKKGVQTSQTADVIVNQLIRNFGLAQLGFKAQIGLKQLASTAAMVEDVKTIDFTAGIVDFFKNPKAALKFMNDNSTFFESRGINIDQDYASLLKDSVNGKMLNFMGRNPNFTKVQMMFIRWGDKGAIAVGGYAHIQAKMKGGASLEEAIQSFERLANRTQQSQDPDQVSELQRSSGFGRVMAQFMSSANAVARGEMSAITEFSKGRLSKKEFTKRMIVYHIIIPQYIQYIANGFDWDEEDQLGALMYGSLNGMFVIGDVLEVAINTINSVIFEDEDVSAKFKRELAIRHPVSMLNSVVEAFNSDDWEDIFSFDSFIEGNKAIDAGTKAVGDVTGVALNALYNDFRGFLRAGEGDDENITKGLFLMFGWSPYVIKKGELGE